MSVEGRGASCRPPKAATHHAKGRDGDAKHAAEVEGCPNGDGQGNNRHNGALVAKGQTVDDVGGGASGAGACHLTHRGVGMGGKVLGDEANAEASPEAGSDAEEGVIPVGEGAIGCVDVVVAEVSASSTPTMMGGRRDITRRGVRLTTNSEGRKMREAKNRSGVMASVVAQSWTLRVHSMASARVTRVKVRARKEQPQQTKMPRAEMTSGYIKEYQWMSAQNQSIRECGKGGRQGGTRRAGDPHGDVHNWGEEAATMRAAQDDSAKEPNKSAPMPATSPTLSPTLSAMVPGLRGSSSGMCFSTLPTRSAPTSAAWRKPSWACKAKQ